MSYFDDYVADGLCCECCGAFIDMDEPGFTRRCGGCREPAPKKPAQPKKRRARK